MRTLLLRRSWKPALTALLQPHALTSTAEASGGVTRALGPTMAAVLADEPVLANGAAAAAGGGKGGKQVGLINHLHSLGSPEEVIELIQSTLQCMGMHAHYNTANTTSVASSVSHLSGCLRRTSCGYMRRCGTSSLQTP